MRYDRLRLPSKGPAVRWIQPAQPARTRVSAHVLAARVINQPITPIRVLAAVIERDGRYLVCQRPIHKRHGGLWEFPGGKLEADETLLQAARRELDEEIGVLAVEIQDPILAVPDPGSDFVIEFVPTVIAGEPTCLEHAQLRWARLHELRDLPLAPSDRRFVEFLLERECDPEEQPQLDG
jgi:8-oxo-dGTP diphosphatase